MSLLPRLTINHRLLLVFTAVLAGFVAMVVSYNQLLEVEHKNATLIASANTFGNLISDLTEITNEVTREEKSFLLTKDIRHAEDFFDEDSFYAYKNTLKKLDAMLTQAEIKGLLKLTQDAWEAYGDAFDRTLNAQVLLGSDRSSGAYGNLSAAANIAEQNIQATNHTQLMLAFLTMRRYEKDFLATNNGDNLILSKTAQAQFSTLLEQTKLPNQQQDAIEHALALYLSSFETIVNAMYRFTASVEDIETKFQIVSNFNKALETQRIVMIENSIKDAELAESNVTKTINLIMLTSSIIITLMLFLLASTLRRSLGKLQDTVQKVSKGNLDARANLQTEDELGVLGAAFDNLLDEKIAIIRRAEFENETLNSSIISIIETVARMSQKDLTVKAIVAEDITGTISDALNLMVSETGDVLAQIRSVAQAVGQAAGAVYDQAETVNEVASQERRLVQKSAEGLHSAGQALSKLAQNAKDANNKADTAMSKTKQALSAVNSSIQGIDKIRDIIRETEKRIKRLGERSQEITGVVNLINAIAERTHILALNASMHAASAGEAGRGFAVVADEVQRLAESSQKATSDISAMVHAIREETADALETMNRLIVQVAEGTRQAQDAGHKMHETEITTENLVKAVQEMAEGADKQAQSALDLRKQSQIIVRSTEQTNQELKEQSTYTVRLMEYANTLRESVSIFKLPNTSK